ncbi:MAG: hypothetical protein H0U86_03855 [Chloroflexi bacterium]|nr:hypothetical protein [Chloroflexota bacterium]
MPLEHGLRRTLLAAWLGQELQLSEEQMSDVYYVALLGTVGCSVEGTLLAAASRDEQAVLADNTTVDPTSNGGQRRAVIRSDLSVNVVVGGRHWTRTNDLLHVKRPRPSAVLPV